jgi:hypothetical protein
VVDLAADETAGSSAALWTSNPGVRRVLVPSRHGPNGNGGWRRLFASARDEPFNDPMKFTFLNGSFDDAVGSDALARALDPLTPAVFLTPPDVQVLGTVLSNFPEALVLLHPLGRPGHDPRLGDVLGFCEHTACRFTALRDLAPFFHTSNLALVHRGDPPQASGALERVCRMFDGNFQFLSLARALVEASERNRDLDEGEDTSSAKVGECSRRAHTPPGAYRRVVERIRQTVADVVPLSSTVLVVSRGDDDLLNLGGRRAWHFPQTSDGLYAGHHPADSAAAIKHLEDLRARGADVLLLPATAFWWLRHYSSFAEHLEQTYELLVRQEDACMIYSLVEETKRGRQRSEKRTSLKRAWGRFRGGFSRPSA